MGRRVAILYYCESDVDALARPLPAMDSSIDLPRALLRGRYMKAAARIENVGVPIDLPIVGTSAEALGRRPATESPGPCCRAGASN